MGNLSISKEIAPMVQVFGGFFLVFVFVLKKGKPV